MTDTLAVSHVHESPAPDSPRPSAAPECTANISMLLDGLIDGRRQRCTGSPQADRGRHTPGSHAQPVTTEVVGVLLASLTRISQKPASSSQGRYDPSSCTLPLLVRVISAAA
jgi:hypothetical protein